LDEVENDNGKITRRGFLLGASALLLLGAAGAGKWSSAESPLLKTRSPARRDPSQARPPYDDGVHPFSIFWITDTQYLSESDPVLFSRTTNWIARNWTTFNGKLVIHTGDLVQTGDILQEWVNADAAMKVLRDNNIPYLWCAGNHDDIVQDDPTYGWAGEQFDSFNPAIVGPKVNGLGYVQWVGDYRNAMNTAVSFAANGYNFLVVNLEWDAPPDATDWLEGLLDDENYKDYYVILGPHAYMDATGSTDDARWGPILADFRRRLRDIMDEHSSNVFLTLNGHFATDSGYHTPQPTNGRNQLMFDRQESTDNPDDPVDSSVQDVLKVGGGTATILTFDTFANTVNVRTFDMFNGQYRTNLADQYSFTMLPNPSILEQTTAVARATR